MDSPDGCNCRHSQIHQHNFLHMLASWNVDFSRIWTMIGRWHSLRNELVEGEWLNSRKKNYQLNKLNLIISYISCIRITSNFEQVYWIQKCCKNLSITCPNMFFVFLGAYLHLYGPLTVCWTSSCIQRRRLSWSLEWQFQKW